MHVNGYKLSNPKFIPSKIKIQIKMEKIKWSEKVTHEQGLGRIGEKRTLLKNINNGYLIYVYTYIHTYIHIYIYIINELRTMLNGWILDP